MTLLGSWHEVFVQISLPFWQATHDYVFVFLRHLFLDLTLKSAQNEWPKYLIEQKDNRQIDNKKQLSMKIPTLCKLRMIDSLYSALPSIMPVTGLENHSRKSRCEPKISGMRKCISDHNSIKLFCNGVPVNNSRLSSGKIGSVMTFDTWTKHLENHCQ